MQNNILDKLQISPIQIKVFIGSFIAMFVMVSLQYLGVHSPIKLSFPSFQNDVVQTTNVDTQKIVEKKGGV